MSPKNLASSFLRANKPATIPTPAPAAQAAPVETGERTRADRNAHTIAATAPRRSTTKTATTKRIGIYFRDDVYEQVRQAFLNEVPYGGPDSITKWISAAILEHEARTPEQRAALAAQLPELPVATDHGQTKSLGLTADVIEAREAGARADTIHRNEHIRPGQFAVEATRVRAARTAAGRR